MEIQKIFSNTENPEERIYSVLMTSEELALFSKKSKKDDDQEEKLSTGDKVNRWAWKHLNTKSDRKLQRALAEDDMNTTFKEGLKYAGKAATLGGVTGAIAGGVIGRNIKTAVKGAGIGAASIGGGSLAGGTVGVALRHQLNKTNAYKKANARTLNQLDLAEEKIDEKTYLKNKKKINKK